GVRRYCAERQAGRRVGGQRVERGDTRCLRQRNAEGLRNSRKRGGHRQRRTGRELRRANEESPLVVGRSFDDRYAVEESAAEGRANRLRQRLPVDDGKHAVRESRVLQGQDGRDGQRTKTGGRRATRLACDDG